MLNHVVGFPLCPLNRSARMRSAWVSERFWLNRVRRIRFVIALDEPAERGRRRKRRERRGRTREAATSAISVRRKRTHTQHAADEATSYAVPEEAGVRIGGMDMRELRPDSGSRLRSGSHHSVMGRWDEPCRESSVCLQGLPQIENITGKQRTDVGRQEAVALARSLCSKALESPLGNGLQRIENDMAESSANYFVANLGPQPSVALRATSAAYLTSCWWLKRSTADSCKHAKFRAKFLVRETCIVARRVGRDAFWAPPRRNT